MKTPKISIVTVCFNMEKYIEQTIQSVINQNYPNLEYIIVDGGSTDRTMDIINKYSNNISIIISEPDHGMYHALNKGFSISTGEIQAWLNADDIYFPWTLATIAEVFSENQNINWIRGIPAFLNENGCLTNVYNNISSAPQKFIKNGWFNDCLFGYLQQESMFWRRSLFEKTEGLNLNYKIATDFELWTKFAKYSELVSIGLPMAAFRKRPQSVSVIGKNNYLSEVEDICSHKPKFFYPIIKFAEISRGTNFLIRLLIWRNAPIYFYSIKLKKWVFKYRVLPLSNMSLLQLFLEV